MDINEILRKKGMTKYRLSVLSGVPHATLNNICSGRSRIEKCSAETLYKLAQILHVTIEDLIIDSIKGVEPPQNTISFELFKSLVVNSAIPKHLHKPCLDQFVQLGKLLFAEGNQTVYLVKYSRNVNLLLYFRKGKKILF